jgi:hypothetical protein
MPGSSAAPGSHLSSAEESRCLVAIPSQPQVYRAFSAEEPLASATVSSWESGQFSAAPASPPAARLRPFVCHATVPGRSWHFTAGPDFPAQRPNRCLRSRNFDLGLA